MRLCGAVGFHLRRAYIGGGEDVLDGLRDLGADTVALDEGNSVVAL